MRMSMSSWWQLVVVVDDAHIAYWAAQEEPTDTDLLIIEHAQELGLLPQ